MHCKCLLVPQSGHSPKLGYASSTFGVRYHETLDFFRITGALRCKANNFLATTSINGSSGSFNFKTLRIRSNAVVISFTVSGPKVVSGIYFLIGIRSPAEIYASDAERLFILLVAARSQG